MARSKKLAIAKLILMGLGIDSRCSHYNRIMDGGFLYSPVATIIFLGIGDGAIFR
jgi:hypothetical protein